MNALRRTRLAIGLTSMALVLSSGCQAGAGESEAGAAVVGKPAPDSASLDVAEIEAAASAKATLTDDGVVRLGWSRDDVAVEVDGMSFPPPAGLGSWAAFTATDVGARVMGDTVVFRDEVDAAIDAALSNGIEVTGLHNHFFYDEPKVYFMHIGGEGEAAALASGVKAMWDAIKAVRQESPQPAERFGGPVPKPREGGLDDKAIGEITGLEAAVNAGGVVKVSVGRQARMAGTEFGGSMGLSTWAAFSGTDELAAMDGDFAMRGDEVSSVLRALRAASIHVVALHNHMTGEEPPIFFVHFWSVGPAAKLATGFKAALAAQGTPPASRSTRWGFDDGAAGELPAGFRAEGTNQRGPVASWSVETDASAPSQPNVLALTDTKQARGSSYNLCWTDSVAFADGVIEVKVKAGSGREDQGGGPIWRVQDKDNYYIARWNPLENNYRLYFVKDGRRVQLSSAEVKADPRQWHTLRIEQAGDEITASFDDEALLEAKDTTFTDAGGIGLWTKADAASFFDDLVVEAATHQVRQ